MTIEPLVYRVGEAWDGRALATIKEALGLKEAAA